MISNRTRNVHDFRLSRHTILKLYGIIHKRKIYENQAKGGLWFLVILTQQVPRGTTCTDYPNELGRIVFLSKV